MKATASERQQRLPRGLLGIAIVALSIHALLGWHAATQLSVTHDEYWHLPVGLLNLKTGMFGYDNLNPPLIRMLAAAPLLLTSAKIDTDGNLDAGHWGDRFLEQNPARYAFLFALGRAVIVLISTAAATLTAIWARALFGDRAGCLAAVLWAFEPNLLAHGALVTTDLGAAASFVAVMYALWRFAQQPSWRSALIFGLLLGLAQLTKFTCLILYPIAIVGFVMGRIDRSAAPAAKRRLAAMWLAALALSLFSLNAGYLFRGSCAPLRSFDFHSQSMRGISKSLSALGGAPVPLPRDYLAGLDRQKQVMEQKHPVFLNGAWSEEGLPHYYLWAMLLKLPLPLWVLLVVAGAGVIATPAAARRLAVQVFILLPAAAMIASAEFSTMQLGVRYVLPALPFLILFASQTAGWIELRPLTVRGAALMLVALAMLASPRFHPHHLAYFNELGGGPLGGRQHLLDSNLDWGQDLNRVKPFMDSHGIDEIGLAYFGTPCPAAMGIKYHVPPSQPAVGWFVVSVNFVQGRPHVVRQPSGALRAVNIGEFSYFQFFTPVEHMGASIDVYHIEPSDLANWHRALRKSR